MGLKIKTPFLRGALSAESTPRSLPPRPTYVAVDPDLAARTTVRNLSYIPVAPANNPSAVE